MEIAIITGASRGIGAAIAKTFAENGIDVVLTCKSNLEKAEAVAAECRAFGVRAMAIAFDVADYAACKSALEEITKEMGKPTILINNAGITDDGLFLRMKEEQFDRVIDANLKSVFTMSSLCSAIMLKNKKGKIISLSSVVGLYGNAGQVNYAAAKAGIIGMTKSMAKELGSRGITVNAIAPGFIATEMTENLNDDLKKAACERIALRRFGGADEVAKLALFLASDNANYITGQVIEISGGLSL